MTPFSVYVHIPYCDSKCPYCDFNSYAAKRWPEAAYVEALRAELRGAAERPEWSTGVVQTIFFGGGTPSLFAAASIGCVLDTVRDLWVTVQPEIEVSLEANPGTVDAVKLQAIRAVGVNRISFGVQSFDPRHLASLGRIHSAEQAISAIGSARLAGFKNLSFDLMFAVPEQTPEDWEADLNTALALAPDHISAYNLTYEEGTAFHAQRRNGTLAPVVEEDELAMFTRTRTRLAEHGYAAYEISNFARTGRECAHNLNYWRAGAYLGIGAGAHSFARLPAPGSRWSNERSPRRYIERVAADGHARVSEERLSATQARGEFAFLGLRCTEGVAADAFADRFGVDFDSAFPHAEALCRDGMLERVDGRWRLTARGLLFADSVFATFM
ncbi:MAG: radical SAM family heme chaperone HemW [Candidatus Binatia bacterium]